MFWCNSNLSLKNRCVIWITDCIRILISPLAIPSLFLTGVYGIFKTHDGRVHARMEIIFHGHPLLVLCMHPQPFTRGNNRIRAMQVQSFSVLVMDPLVGVCTLIYRTVRTVLFCAFWCGTKKPFNEKCWKWIEDVKDTGKTVAAIPSALFLGLVAIVWTGFEPLRDSLFTANKAASIHDLLWNYSQRALKRTLSHASIDLLFHSNQAPFVRRLCYCSGCLLKERASPHSCFQTLT